MSPDQFWVDNGHAKVYRVEGTDGTWRYLNTANVDALEGVRQYP